MINENAAHFRRDGKCETLSQGWKMQDMKILQNTARNENARNAAMESQETVRKHSQSLLNQFQEEQIS